MSQIKIFAAPADADVRLCFLLAEDRLGHYPEFREFFVSKFSLDGVGRDRPGVVQAPSGATYALIFIGRSGEPFPSGVEIFAYADRLEPLDEQTADRDLWAILEWMIEGVGGEWKVDELTATGLLYRIPAATAHAPDGKS
ncbi:hypothetical protein [Bradyrhizobium genosp. P]|uniref:hypothetical protein n=1 Tax=Bradyrhizobium genosp. P TaxID=83641 RepID=UPI003CEA2ADC